MDDKASHTLPRAQIRRVLWTLVPGVWIASTLLGVALRRDAFLHSAAIAFLLTLGGLIAWTIYHRISRRTDGWFVLGILTASAQNGFPGEGILSKDELIAYAIRIALWVVFACILGSALRESPKDDRKPARSPLWDSEIDA